MQKRGPRRKRDRRLEPSCTAPQCGVVRALSLLPELVLRREATALDVASSASPELRLFFRCSGKATLSSSTRSRTRIHCRSRGAGQQLPKGHRPFADPFLAFVFVLDTVPSKRRWFVFCVVAASMKARRAKVGSSSLDSPCSQTLCAVVATGPFSIGQWFLRQIRPSLVLWTR